MQKGLERCCRASIYKVMLLKKKKKEGKGQHLIIGQGKKGQYTRCGIVGCKQWLKRGGRVNGDEDKVCV